MGLFSKDKPTTETTHPTVADIPEGTFPGGAMDVGDADFDTVINRFPLVVIDCWAPWCGPCKMISPVIDDLAVAHKEKIVFGKLNTDANQATAMKFGIMSIPTLMVFKDGKLVDQIVGALPKPVLEQKLTSHL
jgi:thioredoxin 1